MVHTRSQSKRIREAEQGAPLPLPPSKKKKEKLTLLEVYAPGTTKPELWTRIYLQASLCALFLRRHWHYEGMPRSQWMNEQRFVRAFQPLVDERIFDESELPEFLAGFKKDEYVSTLLLRKTDLLASRFDLHVGQSVLSLREMGRPPPEFVKVDWTFTTGEIEEELKRNKIVS